jgi:hypothetical protein
VLQTRCNSVVFPALARPITRMRNRVYFARRSYGSSTLMVGVRDKERLRGNAANDTASLASCLVTSVDTDLGYWLEPNKPSCIKKNKVGRLGSYF